jgi:hypothetical protein
MPILEIRKYTGKTLAEGARIAISGRLWVPGWCLLDKLHDDARSPTRSGATAIAFLDDVPVAIATHDTSTMMAFCRKAVRKNGYARQCVDAIRTPRITSERGGKGSEIFWDKVRISMYGYSY